MIFDNIKTLSFLAALILAVGASGVQSLRLANEQTKFADFRTEVAEREASRERKHSADLLSARQTTQALQNNADVNRKATDAKIRDINTRHAAAIDSLRNRPEARAAHVGGTTEPATNSTGATGRELSGPDGRFLAGEAARADTLRVALEACYKDYDSARDTLRLSGDSLK